MKASNKLAPQAVVTPTEMVDAQRHLVHDAAWASASGALSGGVVVAALGLALGAGPLAIGLLAAVPFLAQAAQLPAVLLVERVRQRKRIGVIALTMARLLLFALALVPLWRPAAALELLIALQAAVAVLAAVAACAVNAWFHQLLPPERLGRFFSKRLVAATVAACVCTLAVGWLVDHPPGGEAMQAYAFAFVLAALAGLASSWNLLQAAEPQMHDAGPPTSVAARLGAAFHDRGFRRLLRLLAGWNMASNLAAPFITVYLLQQLGYGLGTVTALWVTSQAANAATLFAWGRVSDKLSNKGVLAVALPLYFACLLALVFTRVGQPYGLQLPLLYGVHLIMGAAGGGIALATGNLALKLAPQGQGTPYLAACGLVSAVTGGMAPLIAGTLAQWLQSSQLSLVVRWVSAADVREVSVLRFAHLEILFAVAAVLGLYAMHALTRIAEGEEVSERRVIQEFALEAQRSVNHLSTLGGVLGSLFTFERLSERRLFWRRRISSGAR